MTKSALKRLPAPQILDALRSGSGATTLPANYKSITLSYVKGRAGPGTTNFIATHLPRLSFTNPSLPINLKITPSPRIGKCKNPEIIKEKEELRQRIAEGGEESRARIVVEMGKSAEGRMILSKGEGRGKRQLIGADWGMRAVDGGKSKTIDLARLSASDILKAITAAQA